MSNSILTFAGSTRADSYNKKLIEVAVDYGKAQGFNITKIDLRDYPMPLYDGDLEDNDGIPENAMKIRALMKEHAGFLISCPEYNSSISAVLKNTIDWASRPIEGEESLVCFKNKVVSLMSASPGGLGGLRGLVTVRSIFGNIGSIVLPTQIAVPKAYEAFDSEGKMVDPKQQASIEGLVKGLADFIVKI